MVSEPFNTAALNGLCSKDRLDLLDSIDSLRSQGISHYVSLPQIIVCGDQSSGKSSVLEAISGVSFPTKSNLCTRFPTELVLRKTPHTSVTVSIVPHESHPEPEKLSLGDFHEQLDGFDKLSNLIESAKAAMSISTHGRAFSKDLLRIEVSGPDRPHLTIVDLPGLIHSETKQQSASDVELVQDVVQAYMKEPRSIILAVVSAKNDYANQVVLKLARAADTDGNRTLGVITKPDTLIAGSESEAMYASLARNQDIEFRLGWHVLKNMDSETGTWSLADRDIQEEEFFSHGVWGNLSRSLLGVDRLRPRLSKVLLAQIVAELPSLIKEIGIKSDTCRDQLHKLGEPRTTLDDQRRYLLQISQSFQSLLKASVDGTYNDSFFGDAIHEISYEKRIRAVTQNLNLEFAERIARRGHSRKIVDSLGETGVPKGVIMVTREEFMDHIQYLMQRTKGRELPGTFNPMIVADLFLEQSAPWEAITRSHVKKLWKAIDQFLTHTITHVADTTTSKALWKQVFEPALNRLSRSLDEKTTELLMPHQKSHPITYNHYFTEALKKVRSNRAMDEYTKILKDFLGITSLSQVYFSKTLDLEPLLAALVKRAEPDVNRFVCSEALDCMEAYYKVALERFVDDIAVELIEAKLISSLYDIFSPVTVSSMAVDLVVSVAGESEENCAQREQLSRQLDVLMKGSETCKRFIGIGVLDADNNGIESIWPKSPNRKSSDSDTWSRSGSEKVISPPESSHIRESQGSEVIEYPSKNFPEAAVPESDFSYGDDVWDLGAGLKKSKRKGKKSSKRPMTEAE
ncbi:dynamin family protein [Phlyctema vagabunda]|uniref:Dynamin family protein n=1 Tax=Phlyctema vagabunda TaxID=108571 RepID=A0ABR4PI24_9HELO